MQNNKFSSFLRIGQLLKESKTVQLLSPILTGYFFIWAFPDKTGHSFPAGTLLAFFIFFYFESSWQKISLRYDFWRWGLFFVSANFFGYQWLNYTLIEFGQLPAGLANITAVAFALIVFPQFYLYLLARVVARKISPSHLLNISRYVHQDVWPWVLALFVAICEYVVPQQFPGHAGHSWLPLAPYLGMAPVVGVFGLSFFTYLTIFYLRQSLRTGVWSRLTPAVVALFILLNILLPLPPSSQSTNSGPVLKVKIVQANIGNMLKLQAERGYRNAVQTVMSKYEELSLESPHPDLVIWPETSYPTYISTLNLNQQLLGHPRFSNFLGNLGSPVLFGGYIEKPVEDSSFIWSHFEDVYNAAILISPDSVIEQAYFKHHLIPFGETLPFPSGVNQVLAKYLPAVSFFARGDKAVLFNLPLTFKASALICYEVLFSSLVRDQLNELPVVPDFFVNLTNDSWYGPTDEPEQHKFLAHWRALEFQMPILRSTNTGITSVLWADGSESARLKIDELKALDVNIPKRLMSGPTFYQRFGIWTTVVLALVFIGLFSTSYFLEIRRKKNSIVA